MTSNKEEKRFVMILFIFTTVFHCLLAMQDKVMLIYPDELAYLDPARSFMRSGMFAIHNINENWEPVLYSVLLSPFTLIKNSYIQIKVLYIVNCIIMCSSIFPCWILCKKIIQDKTNRMLMLIILAIIPEFTMTQYFMAENLFFPLSVWFFAAVYRYLEEENEKKRRAGSIGLALLCFLLYITKSIALGYCIGFAAMLAYETVFQKKWENFKENLINIIIFSTIVLALMLLFKYYIAVSADVLGTIYDTRGELPLRNFKEVLFLGFCVISYIVYTLLGFFFFPVVIPGVMFQSLNSKNKKFYVFSITALFAMCCAVALICNIREDALEESIRIHMRFYTPLLITFLLLLLSFTKVVFSKLQQRIYGIVSVITIVLMVIALRTPKFGCNLDAWMLLAYKRGMYKICDLLQVNPTHGWPVIFVLLLFIGAVIGFTFWGIRHGHNIKRIMGGILFLIIINNVYIMFIEYNNNKRFQEEIADVVLINKHFNDIDGNILVISKDGSDYVTENAMDTYLSREHFTISYYNLIELLNKNGGVWNIEEKKIIANYPWHEYNYLNQVDYLIVHKENDEKLDKANLQSIYIGGVEKFNVYKNLQPECIQMKVIDLQKENIYIDFSNDGDAADYIVSGWNGQEEEAVWSTGEALLSYDADIDSDFEIMISCGTLMENPEIEFVVDGIEVQNDNIVRTNDGYKVYIGENGYNPDDIKHTILIRDLNATSPSQIWGDNADERILSLFVKEIVIYDR